MIRDFRAHKPKFDNVFFKLAKNILIFEKVL